MLKAFPEVASVNDVLCAMQTVAKAAVKTLGLKPSALSAAFQKIDDSNHGKKFKAGLHSPGSFGAMLDIEARELLATSELDVQRQHDFLIACETIYLAVPTAHLNPDDMDKPDP